MDLAVLLNRLKYVIFPPRCLNCGRVVCYEDLFCEKCGFERSNAEDCLKKLHDAPVSGVIAGTEHSGSLKKAIWTLKDSPDIRIRDFFVQKMFEEINSNWPDFDFDVVVPVPLSPENLKKRGFNQAGLLAEELAKRMKVPYADGVLMRSDTSEVQRTLNFKQRRENAEKSFCAADSKIVKGKSVLLVDDVLTTGATSRACSSLLLDAGAKSVYVAVASSTPAFKDTINVQLFDINCQKNQ